MILCCAVLNYILIALFRVLARQLQENPVVWNEFWVIDLSSFFQLCFWLAGWERGGAHFKRYLVGFDHFGMISASRFVNWVGFATLKLWNWSDQVDEAASMALFSFLMVLLSFLFRREILMALLHPDDKECWFRKLEDVLVPISPPPYLHHLFAWN